MYSMKKILDILATVIVASFIIGVGILGILTLIFVPSFRLFVVALVSIIRIIWAIDRAG